MILLTKIRSLFSNTKVDFMSIHKIAIGFSILCIIASLIAIFTRGLNLGIDFSGGILIEARFEDNVDISKIRNTISSEIKDVQIQSSGEKDILIRISKSNQEQSLVVKSIQKILQQNFSNIEYRKIDYVGPQIGSELIYKGFFALFLSFIFIMIYIWIRFDWQFGLGGIFALVHDAIVTLGFFAITQLEFNLTSIAAILTIIGYSINDSVVIYDRIRENMRKYKKTNLSQIINSSTNSTLSRTVLTASTTLISLLALIIFGGDVLFSFSVATFFGILIGTYSSIYISAPILIYFDPTRGKKTRLNSIRD
jgi:preprotein translocase subunit SecF